MPAFAGIASIICVTLITPKPLATNNILEQKGEGREEERERGERQRVGEMRERWREEREERERERGREREGGVRGEM